jgi:hypothetical protein
MHKRPSAPEPSNELSELIDELGGPVKVVEILQRRIGARITAQAVSNWRRRGIPYRYRAPLALEAAERQIGVPVNFMGEQPPKPPENQVPFLS